MKKVFIIILVISLILNSIPFAPLGKLLAAESNSIEETIVSNYMEGSDEIEYEIESLREPNLKVFKRKDGLIEYNYYEENVHYLEDGIYKEYDVSFNESDSSYSNTVNGYEVVLPKSLKKSNIILRHQEDVLKIKYLSNTSSNSSSKKIKEEKENKKDVITTKSKVEYKNVLKHSIIELIHTPTGLKENIILEKYVKNYSFSYIIETSLKLVNENDTLYFYNDYEKEIFRFNPYNIVDSQNRISYDVELNISITEEGYLVDVIPSDEVLKEFTYPITIDPVIEYSSSTIASNIKTKYFRKNFNGTTPGIKIEKYVNTFQNADGTYGSEDISTLTIMEINKDIFDNNLNVDTIKFAKLKFRIKSSTQDNSYDIAVNRITKFYVGDVTFISYPYDNIDGYTNYETKSIGTMKRVENAYELDLTNVIKETKHNSMVLELTAKNIPNNEENVILYDSSYTDNNQRPMLTIAYMDSMGLIDFLTYHTVTSGNTTAYVNDCFGNLVVEQTDYLSNSEKISFDISHYYNNISSYTTLNYDVGYGSGMTLSYLERVVPETLNTEYYSIIESTGRKKYYKKGAITQNGFNYVSEEGDDEYLTVNLASSVPYKKVIQEKYAYWYDHEGYLVKIIDFFTLTTFIEITYKTTTYEGNKLIDEIKDSSNNYAKFIYENNHLSKIQIYKATYEGENVIGYEISQTNKYEYDSSFRMIKTLYYKGNEEILLGKEEYEYNTTDDTLLKIESYNYNGTEYIFISNMEFLYLNEQVVEYSSLLGSNNENETTMKMYIEYGDRTTTFTNSLGQSTKYLFDYFGHTKTVIDNYGNTTHYKYTNYNNELYKDNPNYVLKHQIEEVSSPINLGYNLIDNHSFEEGENHWNIYSGDIVYTSAYGLKALKVDLSNSNENTVTANQKISVQTNKVYTLTAFIKGSGDILIVSDNENYTVSQSELTETTNDYFLYKKTFSVTSIDPDEEYAEVYINLCTKETDQFSEQVYFDQIMIDKNNIDTIYNMLINPSFEENNSWSGGQRILRTSDQSMFGNYEMKVSGNSIVHQEFDGVHILKDTTITIGGFVRTNGTSVRLRVQFLNSETGSMSNSYVVQFYPYLTDYQFNLSEFSVGDEFSTEYYDVVFFDIINTGEIDCYVDNLILTYDLYEIKYEYNELGYQTKSIHGSAVTLIEYKSDNRTPVKITKDNKELSLDIQTFSTSIEFDNVNITENKNSYNQVTSTTINDKQVSEIEYGYNNQYVTSQTTIGNTVEYSYDYLYGLLNSVEYSDGNTIQYQYDDYNRLLQTSFTKGKISYLYDDYGNIEKIEILGQLDNILMSYYFEYNEHFDIETIYVGQDTNKDRIIKYEYLYLTLSNGNEVYTGLINKVIKGNNDDNYERYEYDKEFNLYKTYIKKPNIEETLISELLYDNYKNLSFYKDYVDNKIYMYNYDKENRLISCLDEEGNGVKYQYLTIDSDQKEKVIVEYIVDNTVLTTMTFIYKEDELIEYLTNDIKSNPQAIIDDYDRVTEKLLTTTDNNELIKFIYQYNEDKISQLDGYEIKIGNDTLKYGYSYDIYGNIIQIIKYKNNVEFEKIEYQYNNNQELLQEKITRNNVILLVTNYTYDTIGNITSITRTTKQGEYSNLPYKIEFIYDTNVRMKLLSYKVYLNSSLSYTTYNITYDEFGNIRYDGKNLFIYDIDKLINIQNDNNNIIYDYNSDGVRIYKKIINLDDTYEEVHYDVSGDIILKETRYDSSTNTTTYIIYIYDESGVVGFKTGTSLDNLTTYYFVKNLQNDVIQIIDINSNVVVEYTYDAYGNVFISGTLSNTIGKLNPYRYRGYYYDEETNLFLVSSRYYSPELCRWISPDSIEYLDSESVNGLNLYCYCLNDPVMCR